MEIGIIIEFNEENGSGVIGNWNERKYILHEYNRSDLKKGDIVIYDCGALQNYHNNERIALYCYNIYRLKDKKDLILKSLETKLFSDFSSLICLVFPEFIDKVI